jgi:DNA-binding CsgD family transcriptional regulator
MTHTPQTSRVERLSEKEKETLRLLGLGHDAKSLARHLGLSVHTVNERLRDARRKLAVSSSREAARQLREVDEAIPNSLGDKTLGAAPANQGVTATNHQTASSGTSRWNGWLIGGITMSVAVALLALVSPSADTSPAELASAHVTSPAETAAADAARRWLALLDTGDWERSWQATGESFQSLNTSTAWAQASQRIRAPLGAIRSRELVQADFAPAPPQGYWTIKFRASYANKANAIEVVSLAAEEGAWKVVGITIE